MTQETPDPKELIQRALELLELRGLTMANFTILSSEMNRLIGRKIAPITLYRITSSKHSKYKPYRFSIALLEEFIAMSQFSQNVTRQRDNRYFTSENPRSTSLYRVLQILINETDPIKFITFFKTLPYENQQLGWERYVISSALADHIHKIQRAPFKDHIFKAIFDSPQFFVYFFETYVDFQFPVLYTHLIKKTIDTPESIIHRTEHLDRKLFLFSILPYIDNNINSSDLRSISIELNDPKTDQYLDNLIIRNPILAGRIIGARILVSFMLNKKLDYKNQIQKLIEYTIHQFDSLKYNFEICFTRGIWLDTLVMCRDKINFTKLVAHTPNPAIGNSGEPQLIRLAVYRSLYYNNMTQFDQLFKTPIYFSEGEIPFHHHLIDSAKKMMK